MIGSLISQEVISLPVQMTNGNVIWENGEKQYHSKVWDTEVVTNVSSPTMLVYKPEESVRNGASVIICPGGGLYAQSINSEGIDVAKWLNKIGVTGIVLKYRVPSITSTAPSPGSRRARISRTAAAP